MQAASVAAEHDLDRDGPPRRTLRLHCAPDGIAERQHSSHIAVPGGRYRGCMPRYPGDHPTDDERRQAYTAVRSVVSGVTVFPPGATETAQFVLDEAKEAYARTSSRADSMESKATTLLGIVAGGSGAFGAFAFSHDARNLVTPFVIGALYCVTIALSSALYMLRAKDVNEVDVRSYESIELVSADHRIPLALLLAGTYGAMHDELRAEIRHEPRALVIAYAATTIAAALILLNVVASARISPSHRVPATTTLSGQMIP
ncbi:MAG TPA: hypothetical protein VGD01_01440 [Candidatus Elarobacter sp.]